MREACQWKILGIKLGENKGDKYGNRWETKTKRIMSIYIYIFAERRTARERGRERERDIR